MHSLQKDPHLAALNYINFDIWKYLKLIMISLASSTKNNTFLETAKLFESLDQETFKEKLQETMENISHLFVNSQPTPSQEQEQEQEEEKLEEQEDNKSSLPKNPFDDKNPAKLMDLVKSVGSKLENKIKSGDIKENELFSEATEIMKNMKNIPGMDNIQDMLKNMGINPNDLKKHMNPNHTHNNTPDKQKHTNSFTKLKEKAKNESKQSQLASQLLQSQNKPNIPLSDEKLISMFTPTNVKKDTKKQKKK